ncbi:MAG: hypothetical protein NC235_08940 [Clostridiales bacterium]|nr:hypothetical protein [Clostridiales bacterium]MCM1435634.1 hypothetical protein [Ruminococcus flavefaciens]
MTKKDQKKLQKSLLSVGKIDYVAAWYFKAEKLMQAYGFSIKMTESECVAELMKLYQNMTK